MSKNLFIGLLVLPLVSCDPFTLFEPQPNRRPPHGQQRPHGQNPRPENLPPGDREMIPPRPPEPEPTRGEYPVARRTANPDQVISPYEPFNVIDVTGFRSGQLARDPSNQKIFRIP